MLRLGSIRDQHIHYRLKSHWFDPTYFVTGATGSSGGNVGPGTLTAGFAADTANLGQIVQENASRYAAVRLSSTGCTLSAVFRPWDMDNRHPLYIRVHWTSGTNTAMTASFSAAFSTITTGAAPATPSTGLTRGIVSEAKAAAAYSWVITRPGAIAPLSTGALAFQTFSPETQAVNFNLALSTVSGAAVSTNPIFIHGVELLYTPRLTGGDGSGVQGLYNSVPLSTMAADPTTDFKVR